MAPERAGVRADVLRARLKRGPPVLLDGAMGTYLGAQGFDITGPLWSTSVLADAPEAVRDAHAAYVQAGAEVLTTVTFRAHPGLFAALGRSEAEWRSALRSGVRAAEEGIRVAGRDRDQVWVAGSLAPVGDSYRPDEVPPEDVLVREHGAQAHALERAGVDLILVETMVMLREARVAVQAANRVGLPVFVSFVVGPEARLLSGEALAFAVPMMESLDVDALLVNCASLENVARAVEVLAATASGPWGVYPNGSAGDPARGWGKVVPPAAFAAAAASSVQAGARLVGSCCMTTPAHTDAIRAALRAAGKR